jgi:hypothetical protein
MRRVTLITFAFALLAAIEPLTAWASGGSPGGF